MELEEINQRSLCIQDLPLEVKLRIFSYLTPQELCKTVSPVCKDWLEISKDPSLWKVLDIQFCDWKSHLEVGQRIRTLLTRCTMLRSLTIRGKRWEEVLVKDTVGLTFSCPTLKVLRIWSCTICPDFLLLLRLNCPALEWLQITECDNRVNIDDLVEAVCSLPSLKCLQLQDMLNVATQLDDTRLRTLVRGCPHLQSLWLKAFQYVTDASVRDLALLRRDTLRQVHLDGRNITDQGLTSLSTCPHLTHLSLQFAADITDEAFLAMTDLGLETLNLNCRLMLPHQKNTRVTSQALSAFFCSPRRSCMTCLGLHGFRGLDDGVLRCLAVACPDLTDLGIRMSDDVTDEGLLAILPGQPKLRYLDVTFCPKISPETIALFPDKVYIKHVIRN